MCQGKAYFFFLVVFFAAFAFFAFFAFLAMLPSVSQRLLQCTSRIDVHECRVHHKCKIDTAGFEEGKRPSRRHDLRTINSLAMHWRDTGKQFAASFKDIPADAVVELRRQRRRSRIGVANCGQVV